MKMLPRLESLTGEAATKEVRQKIQSLFSLPVPPEESFTLKRLDGRSS